MVVGAWGDELVLLVPQAVNAAAINTATANIATLKKRISPFCLLAPENIAQGISLKGKSPKGKSPKG